MTAIDKIIEKFDIMINELNKQDPKDNVSIYLKSQLNIMLVGLKMNAYKYKFEELQENLKNEKI